MSSGSFIDISVIGDKALQKSLRELGAPKYQRKVVRKALREAAKPILRSAREKVPSDTGKLRKGLRIRAAKSRRGRFGIRVMTPPRAYLGIDPEAKGYYPAHVELGTRRMAARPYLRPAFDENREKSLGLFARELRKAIDAEWRKRRGR